MTDHKQTLRIAVLGGTGKEGGGLAARWAHAGHDIIIGSRTQEKADTAATELNATLNINTVRGMTNSEAAAHSDISVLTVPYGAHKPTLEGLREVLNGKILVDVTVPTTFPNLTEAFVPPGLSAAQEAQAILGETVAVVGAFHHISHTHLKHVDDVIDCDVLVCGDDADARQAAITLVEAAGMQGIDAGVLANAVALEAFTPVLIAINRAYKVKGAGLRITGLPPTP